MIQSALEFIEIFRSENFNNLVLSVKSSDTRVMVTANRLLVKMMQDNGFAYPIHLGVTEAGEGEDGRVRSAAGIGTLLSEGIGDTIRVSLSEDPEKEIPVAREIVNFLCGPRGRIKNPVPHQDLRTRNNLYKPEVIKYSDGKYVKEDGSPFQGKMLIFNFNTPPLLSDKPDRKDFLNPIFDEDDPVKLSIDAAAILGRYFILRQAEGICITNRGKVQGAALEELAFSLLQATEARNNQNRYISCPTCGRTKIQPSGKQSESQRRNKSSYGTEENSHYGLYCQRTGEMEGSDYGYVALPKEEGPYIQGNGACI